ncbi:phage tail-collar fiber domain-containing protein [Citrobacter sp. MAL-2]
MSQTAITLEFENWKAQQGATGEPVLLDEFVFANVPGLDTDAPIPRDEAMPPADQIVYRGAVSRKGVVNENAVVHSVVLGADVGDFSFNWIGLINKASGTLAMIVHAPLQQKLKNKEGQQGNVLTRSFLMEYNGAQTETGINTPAETWQIDFTARMAGMDERQRLENMDIYGAAAFFGDGYLVAKTGNQFYVTRGAGYVAGLRAQLNANKNITITTKPVKVWLDVCWTGTLTSVWSVESKITVAADLSDYVSAGIQHYVFALASIDENENITDLRPKGALNEQQANDALRKHELSRNHPDATTSEKGFVQLSSATDSDSEKRAATSKAVKAVNENANGRVSKSGDTMTGKLTLPQTSSFGVNTDNVMGGNSIAIGDNDTGFKLISDGKLSLMANSVQAGYFNEHELQHKDKILTQIFKAIVNNNWSAGAGGFAFQADTEAPFYATPIQRPQNDNNYFPLIKQKIVLDVGYPVTFSMGLLTTGQTTFPQIVIQAKTDTASYDRLWIFDVITGDLRIPGRMLVGDAIFTTSGDSYGSVWGNKWLSQWLSEAFASRDNRINTMATGDWVVQNFVQNVMRGSQGSMTMDGALVEAPEGCFLSGGNGNEGNQVGVALYRPLQIWRGNGWATISG